MGRVISTDRDTIFDMPKQISHTARLIRHTLQSEKRSIAARVSTPSTGTASVPFAVT